MDPGGCKFGHQILNLSLLSLNRFFPVTAMLPLTEFPGFIHVFDKNCHYSKLPSSYAYKLVKANVDSLKLIQLGLALSNYAGHLPDLGTDSCYVWEFNFKGFDFGGNYHNPDTIQLLAEQRIDFVKIREEGILIGAFRRLFLRLKLCLIG
ncbi:probable CCR4-associated factor 1 homolog 11 [Arachis duranensis]|uniref:Uncharacterized protein n=2 Tax=Arachis TaxID=3817 RepID=A0A445D9I5_ARAHY|nr:probable CCR4-associated factor 1 homolog 11 [Arachis duranensis]QHO41154.1 uncharacterized protein DS421_5g143280 [Arachis hypogaea]RYR59834.1 hypothetical protein Ahy_A05g025810 [Arachis hypogaea]